MGLLIAFSQCLRSEPFTDPERMRIPAVVCDQVAVSDQTLSVAKQCATRIMNSGGVDIEWIDVGGCRTEASSFEESKWPRENYLLLVIAPDAFPGSATTDVMGFAPTSTGSYRRAYVFYNRIKAFTQMMAEMLSDVRAGVVLGHVIAHEMGHLLMPGEAHTTVGIMRADWDRRQWIDASAGRLLFSASQASRMRATLLKFN